MSSSWLSLKVSEKIKVHDRVLKPGLFISVPKKVVPLAVRRNRLKRLVREAARHDVFFGDKTKTYYFRILRWPGMIKLDDMKAAIGRLK